MSAPAVAVVGHVEWVDFVRVAALPRQGEIVHASAVHTAAAGGGSMAAFQLSALAGRCTFLCAVGGDAAGEAALEDLRARGLDVHAARREGSPQRRAVTLLDDDHERTIVVARERLVPHGADPLPWDAAAGWDAVYVTGGDAAAVRAARAARVVVATPRARDALLGSGVVVDVLVASSGDAGERVDEALRATARTVVFTEGADGGRWTASPASSGVSTPTSGVDTPLDASDGRWGPAPLPGVPVDAYGCGDTFAAGLTYGLASGLGMEGATALGARCGAATLCLPAPQVSAAP